MPYLNVRPYFAFVTLLSGTKQELPNEIMKVVMRLNTLKYQGVIPSIHFLFK